MNKFFDYYNSLCVGINSPTVFSFDPYVTAIKELLVSELQQIVYYIEKLKDLNIDMTLYTDKVIEFISVLIVNQDFDKDSSFVIIEDLYENKKTLEKMYVSACEKNKINAELLDDSMQNLSSEELVIKALNSKERNEKSSSNSFSFDKNKKNLYEIMINLVLNSCNCLIELKSFDIDFKEGKDEVLKLLNSTNFPFLSNNDLVDVIKDFSKCNYKITKCLYENIIKKYGPVLQKEVSLCTKEGKAILVSGNGLNELEKILIATEGLNINVYTHNEMICAFQYKNFEQYTNLVGHYQSLNSNFQLDFSTFPGPIFISGNSSSKIDVIRGQIYSSAKYPAYGFAKISDNDFAPLVKYALESKGFKDDKLTKKFKIGYSDLEIKKNIDNILTLFKQNKISNIFVIGLLDQFNQSNEYIKKFIKDVTDSSFVISFSYDSSKNNFWKVNSYFDFSILYYILEQLSRNDKDILSKVSIFMADCNSSTIAHLFNFIHLGIKNIFLGPCCPNIINPVLIDGLQNLFNIKPLTNPIDDIKSINA